MIIDKEVLDIINSISSKGYKVYLVGGSVRDILSNKEINDFDIVTNMPFQELEKEYKIKKFKENENRNTVLIKSKNYDIEISQMKGNTIEEDLSKRDFTINAIAIDNNMNIIDPFNGINDIKENKIRLINNNEKILEKDPLRILRAIRLSATKGYEIDKETEILMKKYRSKLNEVAPERISKELVIILSQEKPSKYIRKYKEIFFEIIPELKETYNFEQHNNYHIYDVFNHILEVLDNTPNDINIRMAALFHDIGKPRVFKMDDKGIGHFLGHEKESARIFEKFAEKYRIPSYNKKLISKLIIYHERMLSKKSTGIKKFFQSFGTNEYEISLLFNLKRADVLGQNPKYIDRIGYLNELEEEYIKVLKEKPTLGIKDLKINGEEIKRLNIFGKDIGIVLKDVLEKVVNEELDNNKEAIINYIESNKRR